MKTIRRKFSILQNQVTKSPEGKYPESNRVTVTFAIDLTPMVVRLLLRELKSYETTF